MWSRVWTMPMVYYTISTQICYIVYKSSRTLLRGLSWEQLDMTVPPHCYIHFIGFRSTREYCLSILSWITNAYMDMHQSILASSWLWVAILVISDLEINVCICILRQKQSLAIGHLWTLHRLYGTIYHYYSDLLLQLSCLRNLLKRICLKANHSI